MNSVHYQKKGENNANRTEPNRTEPNRTEPNRTSNSDGSRRKLLKSLAAGSGAIVAGKSLPDSWTKPVVDSVILPAHAQTSPTLYAIGDAGPAGGIVFYITPGSGGLNGLEAALSDQGSAPWGCFGTTIPGGATGTAIGDGAANTAAILAGCSESPITAELATNFGAGWFLPSQDELNELYLQRTVVGVFAFSNYSSSSEGGANSAYGQDFSSGSQVVFSKGSMLGVRAVRGF